MIDRVVLLRAPTEIAERALSALVFALSGGPYPPRRRSVACLLRVLDGGAAAGHVLGSLRFVVWRGRVLVLRELVRAAAPMRVEPGATAVWDRRFLVIHPACGGGLTLGYLGRESPGELRREQQSWRHSAVPPIARPVLPAFRDEAGLAAVPAIGYRRDREIVVPQLALRPVNALSSASFAVV